MWFTAGPFASPGARTGVWRLKATGTRAPMPHVSMRTDTHADVEAAGNVAHILCAIQHQTDMCHGGTSAPGREPRAADLVEPQFFDLLRPARVLVLLHPDC